MKIKMDFPMSAKNGRVDPKNIKAKISNYKELFIDTKTSIGELRSEQSMDTTIDLTNAAILVEDLTYQNGKLEVYMSSLGTPKGKELERLIIEDKPIGMIPRMWGRPKEDGTIEIVRFISFDVFPGEK